jgi:hypothetical protein
VTILDEDIDSVERERLRAWKIPFRRIGGEIGRAGMKDQDEIIARLHRLRGRRPTLFSRDHGFYNPRLRHARYCLVYLDIAFDEVADYVRRFLRPPAFRIQAQRMGKVVRVRHSGITFWQMNDNNEHLIGWQ